MDEVVNPDHPVTKASMGNWHKIAAVLVFMAQRDHGATELLITGKDIQEFAAAHPDSAVLLHDKADGLHLKIVTMAEAVALAEGERHGRTDN